MTDSLCRKRKLAYSFIPCGHDVTSRIRKKVLNEGSDDKKGCQG